MTPAQHIFTRISPAIVGAAGTQAADPLSNAAYKNGHCLAISAPLNKPRKHDPQDMDKGGA